VEVWLLIVKGFVSFLPKPLLLDLLVRCTEGEKSDSSPFEFCSLSLFDTEDTDSDFSSMVSITEF